MLLRNQQVFFRSWSFLETVEEQSQRRHAEQQWTTLGMHVAAQGAWEADPMAQVGRHEHCLAKRRANDPHRMQKLTGAEPCKAPHTTCSTRSATFRSVCALRLRTGTLLRSCPSAAREHVAHPQVDHSKNHLWGATSATACSNALRKVRGSNHTQTHLVEPPTKCGGETVWWWCRLGMNDDGNMSGHHSVTAPTAGLTSLTARQIQEGGCEATLASGWRVFGCLLWELTCQLTHTIFAYR